MQKEGLRNFIVQHFPPAEEAMEAILASFESIQISKNEFFLKNGRVSDTYLFLESGLMRSFTLDPKGNEITTGFFSKNKFVFEVSSFFLRTASVESIQAIVDCKGYVITFEKLNRLFHAHAVFREFGRMILVKEFAAFKLRTLDMINKSAEERYGNLIENNKEIFQQAQLKHIASYLGITDTSLSRIRRLALKANPGI